MDKKSEVEDNTKNENKNWQILILINLYILNKDKTITHSFNISNAQC